MLKYELGYYHYTLYYYDRAGNLVQTVPPKEVNTASTNRLQHPVHGLPSQYQYNSLQELVSQNNPDGGETKFYYNRKGQLRFSRNAQQIDDGTLSYTRYDKLGRIAEIGKSNYGGQDLTTSVLTDDQTFPSTACTERIYTIYTEPAPAGMLMPGRTQRYLLNRVSYVRTDDNASTVYSYDPHGNVEWIIQVVPNLGKKAIEYQYDLLSNKVTQIRYNPDLIDQFFTKYTYDADNRLSKVRSSRDDINWDKDASYEYYEHGPLRRNQLGEDRIQGIDYTYTLQGWLKSINHPSLQTANDPGQDGMNDVGTAPDIFASGLTYWGNDFVKAGSPFAAGNTAFLAPSKTLYNGNISAWTTNTAITTALAPGFKYPGLTGQKFEYDELNRLRSSAFRNFQGNTWNNTLEYGSSYTYDANGNIDKLNRNAFQTVACGSSISKMDEFTYNLNPNTNQLKYVKDNVCNAAYSVDIDDQISTNYDYDKIGNLKSDAAEGLTISWNLMGKVKQVKKQGGLTIDFTYDASGNRIAKVVFDPVTSKTNSTWYVHDAAGNLLSTYREEKTSTGAWKQWQDEILLYGSERLGVYEPTWLSEYKQVNGTWQSITTLGDAVWGSRKVGLRTYELNDHLGDVRATISDIKLSTVNSTGVVQGVFAADIRSAAEYYPFGMGMPERSFAVGGYRFGFQGQEKDAEISVSGESYAAMFWEYDARLGRRWNTDLVSNASESSYSTFFNNPIIFIDPFGASATEANVGGFKKWFTKIKHKVRVGFRQLQKGPRGRIPVETKPKHKQKSKKNTPKSDETLTVDSENSDSREREERIDPIPILPPRLFNMNGVPPLFTPTPPPIIAPIIPLPRIIIPPVPPVINIAFQISSNRFANARQARNQLGPVAAFLVSNPNLSLLVIGNMFNPTMIQGNNANALNQNAWLNGNLVNARTLMNSRANAIVNQLIIMGVNPNQLRFGPGRIQNNPSGLGTNFIFR